MAFANNSPGCGCRCGGVTCQPCPIPAQDLWIDGTYHLSTKTGASPGSIVASGTFSVRLKYYSNPATGPLPSSFATANWQSDRFPLPSSATGFAPWIGIGLICASAVRWRIFVVGVPGATGNYNEFSRPTYYFNQTSLPGQTQEAFGTPHLDLDSDNASSVCSPLAVQIPMVPNNQYELMVVTLA